MKRIWKGLEEDICRFHACKNKNKKALESCYNDHANHIWIEAVDVHQRDSDQIERILKKIDELPFTKKGVNLSLESVERAERKHFRDIILEETKEVE